MQTTYRWVLAATALLASTALWAEAPANFEKEVPATAKGVVEISNTSGTIEVTGWDKAAVGVKAELGSGVDHVEVTSAGNHTTVRVELRGHGVGFNWGHDETHLHVQVPHLDNLFGHVAHRLGRDARAMGIAERFAAQLEQDAGKFRFL